MQRPHFGRGQNEGPPTQLPHRIVEHSEKVGLASRSPVSERLFSGSHLDYSAEKPFNGLPFATVLVSVRNVPSPLPGSRITTSWQIIARSAFPSPSKSPIATECRLSEGLTLY